MEENPALASSSVVLVYLRMHSCEIHEETNPIQIKTFWLSWTGEKGSHKPWSTGNSLFQNEMRSLHCKHCCAGCPVRLTESYKWRMDRCGIEVSGEGSWSSWIFGSPQLQYSLTCTLNTGSLNVFAEMKQAVLRRFANMPISGDFQSWQLPGVAQTVRGSVTAVIHTIHSICTIRSISCSWNPVHSCYSGHGACLEAVLVQVDQKFEFSIKMKFLTSGQLSLSFPNKYNVLHVWVCK